MSESYEKDLQLEGELRISVEDLAIADVNDEIRADEICRKLLKRFYLNLLEAGMDPVEATGLAGSADYYVRDFVVGYLHANLLEEKPGLVRRFAGNWYIINTIEPDIAELVRHLMGVRAFYDFLLASGLISVSLHDSALRDCADTAYYDQRIESFWAIQGDGYLAWDRECPLKG